VRPTAWTYEDIRSDEVTADIAQARADRPLHRLRVIRAVIEQIVQLDSGERHDVPQPGARRRIDVEHQYER
jgi:hypothetical protein